MYVNKGPNAINLYYNFLQSKALESFISDKSYTEIFKLKHDPWFQLTTDITRMNSMVVKIWINDLKIIFRPRISILQGCDSNEKSRTTCMNYPCNLFLMMNKESHIKISFGLSTERFKTDFPNELKSNYVWVQNYHGNHPQTPFDIKVVCLQWDNQW